MIKSKVVIPGTRVFLGAFVSLATAALSPGSSVEKPENVGIAAIEMKTGKVLWEAWSAEQVPKIHRPQSQRLMLQWEAYHFPATFEWNRLPDFKADRAGNRLSLTLGEMPVSPYLRGAAPETRHIPWTADQQPLIFEDVRSATDGGTHLSERHFFLVAGNLLHAVTMNLPEQIPVLKIAWSLDLEPEEPPSPDGLDSEDRGSEWRIVVEGNLVWAYSMTRLVVVQSDGEVLLNERVNAGEWPDESKQRRLPILKFDEDLALFRYPDQVQAIDRFTGAPRWTLPANPKIPKHDGWFLNVPQLELILIETTLSGKPVADARANGEKIFMIPVDRKSGEPVHDRDDFPEREPNLNFVGTYQPFNRVTREPQYLGLAEPKTEEPIVQFFHPRSRNWKETLNHFLIYYEDRVIRCFERKLPAAGKEWGPKWKFDFAHEGVAMALQDDQIWVAGKGRLVCLDLDGNLIKDFAAPENLMFPHPLGMGSADPRIRLDPDVIFILSHDLTALDRETGQIRWTYTNHVLSTWDFEIVRVPDSDLVLVPTAGAILSGTKLILDAGSALAGLGWQNDWIRELPAKRSEWAVPMIEMARAYGDRVTQIRLKDRRFGKDDLTPAAIESIEKIANSEWPLARSKAALTQFCLKKLSEIKPSPDDPDNPGSPLRASSRFLYWLALFESPPPRDPETRDLLARACIRSLESGPIHEHPFVEKVFTAQCADSELVDAEVIERVLVDRGFRSSAAEWHRKRGDYETASRIVLDSPDTGQKNLLPKDFYDLSRSVPPEPMEVRLLVGQLGDQPRSTVRAVHPFFRKHPEWLPEPFVDLLREIVKLESKSPEVPGKDPRGWPQPPNFLPEHLELLHLAGNPDDTELLRAFLNHPFYKRSEYFARREKKKSYRTIVHDYVVRQMAARILEERGEKIPESVVLVVEFEEAY